MHMRLEELHADSVHLSPDVSQALLDRIIGDTKYWNMSLGVFLCFEIPDFVNFFLFLDTSLHKNFFFFFTCLWLPLVVCRYLRMLEIWWSPT